MKYRDLIKGTRAVKPVSLPLRVEAAQPGQPPSGVPTEFKLGLRVLTGAETAGVLEKAIAEAKTRGVESWDGDHPICRLLETVHRLALASVEVDQVTGLPENPSALVPCFESAAEIEDIDTDAIVFLNDAWLEWQAECSPSFKRLTSEQAITLVLKDMDREGDDPGPLVSMPRATLVSCTRFMAALLVSSQKAKLHSGELSESGSSMSIKPDEPTSSTTSSESSSA